MVHERKTFPESSLIIGAPGKVKRKIEESEIEDIADNAEEYAGFSGKKGKKK
jgi:carbonic anhydrase/acetyltransferase-like protein (isoleucine patch superfamily)